MVFAIWKYPLPVRYEPVALYMPVGAYILTAQTQGNKPTLWVQVPINSKEMKTERRYFAIKGSGQEYLTQYHPYKGPGSLTGVFPNYIGTCQTRFMLFRRRVCHVFEILPEQAKEYGLEVPTPPQQLPKVPLDKLPE